MSLEVAELQEAGKFDKIADPRTSAEMGPSFAPDIKDLQSRRLMLNEVLEALKDDKISEVGICGMSGVGKTRMAKQIMKIVEGGVVFDKVAMAVMSQNPNWWKIQDEIASWLGLKFVEDSSLGRAAQLHWRATQLRSRIMNNDKRILIILDDAWKRPDFEAIGLPLAGEKNGYKIVLTSQYQNICEATNGQKMFIMEVLSDKEGFDLFRETVGDSVQHPDLLPIAEEITNECGGLPIAIVTIAKALKGKSINMWENALLELRKCVPGVQRPAYSCIELSYNYLIKEETKSCFLLCCLSPEDCNIRTQFLVDCGFGLGLFEGVENLKEARNRVHALLSDLQASFLLLDGDVSESVKMHDLVRDVAISIASKDKNEFLVRHEDVMEGWPQPCRYKYCTAISLLYKKINKHPNHLDCPKLEVLQVLCENDKFVDSPSVTDNFFEGMKGLKVLYWQNQSILPQSLQLLKNLRTLILNDSKLGGLSIVGALEKLEILRFGIDGLTELPREFGQLTRLLSLDLRGCDDLKHIPPDVLSRLSKLEELYIPLSFKNWDTVIEEEEDARKIVNASIGELESLRLTVLEVCIPDASLFGVNESFFRNLKTFKVIFGSRASYDLDYDEGNFLRLEGNYNDYQKYGIYVLGNKIEALELKVVNNLKNILPNLDKNYFPRLKVLHVSSCNELEYIVDGTEHIERSTAFPQVEELYLSNLREISHKHLPRSSWFGNLRELHVYYCNKLKFVFTLSMARCLCQLQELVIYECKGMEGVLLVRNEEDKKITRDVIFPKLTSMMLQGLPKLFSFCIEINNTVAEKTLMNQKDVDEGTEELTAFEMEFQVADSIKLRPIFFSAPCPKVPNLEKLRLCNCSLPVAVFSPSIVNQFAQLKSLGIHVCHSMECIVMGEDKEGKSKEKVIANEIIEEVEEEEEHARSDKIVFPQLRLLDICYFRNLKCFYGGSQALELPLLKHVNYASDCMETFSVGDLSTPMLEKIGLNDIFYNNYLLREGDLNATIQHLFKTQYKFENSPDLEEASSSTN